MILNRKLKNNFINHEDKELGIFILGLTLFHLHETYAIISVDDISDVVDTNKTETVCTM